MSPKADNQQCTPRKIYEPYISAATTYAERDKQYRVAKTNPNMLFNKIHKIYYDTIRSITIPLFIIDNEQEYTCVLQAKFNYFY